MARRLSPVKPDPPTASAAKVNRSHKFVFSEGAAAAWEELSMIRQSQWLKERLNIRARMSSDKKFGGGRPPTGTPSLALFSVVIVVSLLAGASIVHNIYKPDMTIPPVESARDGSGNSQKS